MKAIQGYGLREKIHESERTLVYRAVREVDGAPVILKLLWQEQPTPSEIARYGREYEVLSRFDFPGIIRAFALEWQKGRPALVMEDAGSGSLAALLAARRADGNPALGLAETLAIGARAAYALAEVHRGDVIHKDVNPSNLIVHPDTQEVKIIDFGLATLLSRENPTPRSPNVLEGTLRYIAPEQTGRMNRVIDYRTDLYSLGATLYEMLVGEPPFTAEDAMELVHQHIALEPVSPSVRRPEIPEPVSAVILKLLAKSADARYQSAYGLALDLEELLIAVRAGGPIGDDGGYRAQTPGFIPGRRDVSDRLRIPQKLYGREAELGVLLSAFDRVASGATETMLVAGYSGVGKSALVNEIHRPISERRGYFISGKFDQLKRDVPYASLIEAFQDLVRQLLTESEERLRSWRLKLLGALGPNGGVITEVIPEVELIIGEPAETAALGPTEAQNRFNFVFQSFVRCFAAAEHPLVIFLDDLQWADAASLKLIELLVADPTTRHLFVLGAYRDNEVGATHPLLHSLEAIKASGGKVTTLALRPLELVHVQALVEDALACGPERGGPLARLLLAKTGGNPFFLSQFLRSLDEERLLVFDREIGIWRWDTDEIQGRGFTDNVVELMAGKIQKLSPRAQRALQLASCIGNHFQLDTLATVAEETLAEAAEDLWAAAQEGLLLSIDDDFQHAQPVKSVPEATLAGAAGNVSYRFLHDRVQQAAYSLITESSRGEIHLRIGRLLQASVADGELDELIFEIVNHLDKGADLVVSTADRWDLVRLNLSAARKAKASAAFEPALRYLDVALRMLPAGAWATDHELTFALHAEAMEVEYLNARLDRARELATAAMAEAKTPLEKVKLLETKMLFHTARNEIPDTIATAWEALALLGVALPPTSEVTMDTVIAAMTGTAVRVAQRSRTPHDLLSLPAMTDPGMLAALRIMSTAGAPTYIASPISFPVLVCKMVDICLEYGNAVYAPYGWSSYGLCQTDVELANAYGDLALATVDRFGDRDKAKTLVVVNICIRHWKIHTRETLEPLLEAIRSGLELGDIEFVGYGADHYCKDIFYVGEPLEFVARECAKYVALMTAFKQEFNRIYLCVIAQAVENLLGIAPEPTVMNGASFDETTLLPKLIAANNNTSLCLFYSCRATLAYLFGDFEKALADGAEARKYIGGAAGMNVNAVHAFYESLAALALHDGATDERRKELLGLVEQNQAKLQKWAHDGPANYEHRYVLVEAERARVEGGTTEAIDGYERAIRIAAQHQYVQEEAVACERAAVFHLAAGRTKIGESYLTEARFGYVRWGAAAKVAELDRRYLGFFSARQSARRQRPGRDGGFRPQTPGSIHAGTSSASISTSTSSTSHGAVLDLATVMKAAQAISGEIVLPRLIEALMRNVVENAGAQRGVLLLEHDGRLQIEAEWSSGADAVDMTRGPLAGSLRVSESIVNFVARTRENTILIDASAEGLSTKDPYVLLHHPKSVLAAPLVNQGKLVAVLYLENNLTDGAFTEDRIELLRLLLAQAALSISNAKLYASVQASNEKLEDYSRTLEERVNERTREVREKHDELATTLGQLRITQKQLVTQEKLASLGALTAGIAHEIKNPLNFVNNFAELSVGLADEIGEVLASQRARLDVATLGDVDAALDDLRQNMLKINEHGKRANSIVNGMLQHAHDTVSAREAADLNALVAECIDLAYHGIRGKDPGFQVSIDAVYDDGMDLAEIASSEVSRVFINVLNNACYATQQKKRALGAIYQPKLTVRTHDRGQNVEVRIRDNGTGIPNHVIEKIYNPFFTTKPPGEGTGLGLSISYDIIVHGHQGEIRADTQPGEFTEFIISVPKVARASLL